MSLFASHNEYFFADCNNSFKYNSITKKRKRIIIKNNNFNIHLITLYLAQTNHFI